KCLNATRPMRRLLLSGLPLVLMTRYFGMRSDLTRFPAPGKPLFSLTGALQRAGEYVGAVNQGKTQAHESHAFRRLKFWVWFQEHTRPSDLQVTLFWAGVIGFCGGLASIAFRAG